MAGGLRELAGLPDPIGTVVRGSVLPNGLHLTQVRVPLGVVAIIYEARPNVTVDAAGIALKAGQRRAAARVRRPPTSPTGCWSDILADAAVGAGLPADAVQLVPGTDRESVKHLMTARGLVDVIIPRGGAGLIQAVVNGSTVPVIETGVGNCHVYVDASADHGDGAGDPGQLQGPAAVGLQRGRDPAGARRCAADVRAGGRRRRCGRPASRCMPTTRDRRCVGDVPGVVPATAEDFDTEYLSLDIAVAVVADLDAAIEPHLASTAPATPRRSSRRRWRRADEFVARVDAAAVMVNASTAFTDGGEFGFGAEIGISTQKLHARGPMGLAELTSTKYVVTGNGQIRASS